MSEQDIQETLEPLENDIKALVEGAKMFEQLKSLTKQIPNLLKLEQTISNYQKKSKELKNLLKTNKTLTKSVKDNLQNFPKRLETKINESKSSTNSVIEDSSIKEIIDEKKLLIYFKEEICQVVKHLDNNMKKQNNAMIFDIETTKKDVEKYKAQINGEEIKDEDKKDNENEQGNKQEKIESKEIAQNVKDKLTKHVEENLQFAIKKCEELGDEKVSMLEKHCEEVVKGLQSGRK